jgi:hypothetical protein
MATFPLLRSGAVAQYPSSIGTGQGVQIIQFLDGLEQRFLNQGRQLRRWGINLSLLSDSELRALEEFFTSQSGDYSTFSFPDPVSGTEILNCRFGGPELTADFIGVNSNAVSFWIIETNG